MQQKLASMISSANDKTQLFYWMGIFTQLLPMGYQLHWFVDEN